LPEFNAGASIPLPLRNGGTLPFFERGAAERADPILQEFEAKLGANGYAGRVVTLDYTTARLAIAPSDRRA